MNNPLFNGSLHRSWNELTRASAEFCLVKLSVRESASLRCPASAAYVSGYALCSEAIEKKENLK